MDKCEVRHWLVLERADLGKRTVSAYQKAILEAEYDRLLLELI